MHCGPFSWWSSDFVELLTELLNALSGNAVVSDIEVISLPFESSYFPSEMHCGSITSGQIDG